MNCLTSSRAVCILCGVICCMMIQARTQRGIVRGNCDGETVVGAYVSLFEGDSLSRVAMTDGEGRFELQMPDSTKCGMTVTALGYKDVELSLMTDTLPPLLTIMMDENEAIALGEVVVAADKSQLVKRTANGQIFYLSDKSKSIRNPFRALQEIPLLISDDATSSITMLDGKKPLILIDGNRVNSGIAPINPSDIESVEVINIVPARYLQEGFDGIINIKLKKTAGPYLWTEVATRHEIPLHKGFGVGYFEVGNKRYSLYGRGVYNYTHDDDIQNDITRTTNDGSQLISSTERSNGHSWIGELLLKCNIAPQDYLALHAYIYREHSTSVTDGYGEYLTDSHRPYALNGSEQNDGTVVTSSLYFKHAFSSTDDNTLEIRAAYNHNSNSLDSHQTESYGYDWTKDSYMTSFDNERNSGNVDMDYSRVFSSGYSISAGSHSKVQSDRIGQSSAVQPVFSHRNINEYLFASLSGKVSSIYFMASLGLEMIWLKAGETANSYLRPRASLSATWNISTNHSIQCGYTLSNETPPVAKLNPYNTSTDPRLVTSGNPYLTPQATNRASINYTYTQGNLYLQPALIYRSVSDIIEPTGYLEGDVYHSTYTNSGHFSQLMASAYASYRFGWGRIGLGCGWSEHYYHGSGPQGAFSTMFDFNARAGKFSFYANINYTNREIYRTSIVRNLSPSLAQIQVNYNITPDLYIALCMQNIAGKVRSRTIIDDGGYHSVAQTSYCDRNIRPWLLVRYTFRKNAQSKINLGNNVIRPEENGINLKAKSR